MDQQARISEHKELLHAVSAALLAHYQSTPTGTDETARAASWEQAAAALDAIRDAGFIISRKAGDYIVGDEVEKVTGDYGLPGIVRAAFTVSDEGPARYVVAHDCQGLGGFGKILHIYAPANLRRWQP